VLWRFVQAINIPNSAKGFRKSALGYAVNYLIYGSLALSAVRVSVQEAAAMNIPLVTWSGSVERLSVHHRLGFLSVLIQPIAPPSEEQFNAALG